MESKQRERLLVAGAIACMVLLFGDWLVVEPLRSVWGARAARIAELRKSVAEGALLLERLDPLEARWNAMTSHTLPSNSSTAESQIFKSVDRWMTESNLLLTTLKPQWTRETGAFIKREYRASAQGGIREAIRFLYELEKDPLALKIEELQILSRDQTGQSLSLNLRFCGLQAGGEKDAQEKGGQP